MTDVEFGQLIGYAKSQKIHVFYSSAWGWLYCSFWQNRIRITTQDSYQSAFAKVILLKNR
jgi:hypothetical protein